MRHVCVPATHPVHYSKMWNISPGQRFQLLIHTHSNWVRSCPEFAVAPSVGLPPGPWHVTTGSLQQRTKLTGRFWFLTGPSGHPKHQLLKDSSGRILQGTPTRSPSTLEVCLETATHWRSYGKMNIIPRDTYSRLTDPGQQTSFSLFREILIPQELSYEGGRTWTVTAVNKQRYPPG